MSQTIYRVAKGVIRKSRKPGESRSFNTAADFIGQGEVIPQGMLSDAEIAGLMSSGKIEPVREDPANPAAAIVVHRGKWSVDPASLVGKSHEQLVMMVMEIDPEFDVSTLTDEIAAVTLLTTDWNPAFRDTLSKSTDRSRAERLGANGVKSAGERPMSYSAQRALENARAKANPPEDSPESHG